MQETIATFRSFNRFYTRLLGLFRRHLLYGPLTLAETRTLYEIAMTPGISASDICHCLGMDRGQLSRILTAFRKKGLIERKGTPGGRSPLPLYLTEDGKVLLAELENQANDHAAGTMRGLGPRDRARLRGALEEARRLLERGAESAHAGGGEDAVRIRPAAPGELGWIITRHSDLYAQECAFTGEFEEYVLLTIADYLEQKHAGQVDASGVWIAEYRGEPAGSIAIVPARDDATGATAQLRWLLVEPHTRGLGLGRRLVDHAVAFARNHGYARIVLHTVGELHAARALYASAGFKIVEQKQGRVGGKSEVEECWVMELNGSGRSTKGSQDRDHGFLDSSAP